MSYLESQVEDVFVCPVADWAASYGFRDSQLLVEFYVFVEEAKMVGRLDDSYAAGIARSAEYACI